MGAHRKSTGVMRAVRRQRSGLIAIPVVAAVIVGAYYAAVAVRPILEVRMQVGRLRDLPPEDDEAEREIRESLMRAGEKAVEPCAELAADGSAPEGSRRLSLDVLVHLGMAGKASPETVYRALSGIAYSESSPSELRLRALKSLVIRREARLQDKLPELAGASDAAFRMEVIRAAGHFGGPSSWRLLVGMLGDPDPKVRSAARSALASTDSPKEAVSALVERLREVKPVKAGAIVNVISRITGHDFRLSTDWTRLDFYGGLRHVEKDLDRIAYVLPVDGTELIEHDIETTVPSRLRYVSIQRAAGEIVVTLAQAERGRPEAFLGDIADLAGKWSELESVESAQAYKGYRGYQLRAGPDGRTRAHFFVLITLKSD